MKTILNIETWKRREHYLFFSGFDDPFFGVTTTFDCTHIYEQAKHIGVSFNLCLIHKLLKAVNKIEEFRYRIENGSVFVYDVIHASPTIARKDDTFCFGFLEFNEDLNVFIAISKQKIAAKADTVGLQLDGDCKRNDVIHYSALPWFGFTDMKHPYSFKTEDSVPKISVGKFSVENNEMRIPISITAHHGLMDGVHIAKLIDELESL